jgi:phosphoribosylglycinamide formyltransferase 2
MKEPGSDIRVFGKPATRPYRRMAVALVSGPAGSDIEKIKEKAKELAGKIRIQY